MVTSPMYNPQQQIPTTKINQKKKKVINPMARLDFN